MIEVDDGRRAMICRWLLSFRSKSLWISFRSRNLIPEALRVERVSSRDTNVFSNDELNFNTSQLSISIINHVTRQQVALSTDVHIQTILIN